MSRDDIKAGKRLLHRDHYSGALWRMQIKRRCWRQTDRQTNKQRHHLEPTFHYVENVRLLNLGTF